MKHDVSLPHSRPATSEKEMKDANKFPHPPIHTLMLHVAIEDQFSLSVRQDMLIRKLGDLVSNDV